MSFDIKYIVIETAKQDCNMMPTAMCKVLIRKTCRHNSYLIEALKAKWRLYNEYQYVRLEINIS